MPRSFRQFGLRTLLLFCTLAAVCFGLWRWHMTWVDHQHDLAQQIADKKGDVRWQTWGPSVVHDLLGSYYFSNIVAVDLSHKRIRDEDLQLLREIPTLEELYVPGNHAITDGGMQILADLPRIRKLAIWNTKLTDKTLKLVGTLNDLEVLDMHRTNMSETGLAHLAGLPKLARWHHGWPISDIVIATMATLPSLEVSSIRAKDLADASFQLLKQIPVKALIVTRPQGDQWGTYLLDHPTLKSLQVYQGKMSDTQLRKMLLSNRLNNLKLEDVPVGDNALFARLEGMRTTRLTLVRTNITPKALLENLGPDAALVEIHADFVQPVVKIRLSGAPFGPDCFWTGSFDPADLQYLRHCHDVVSLSIHGQRLCSPREPIFSDPEARRKFEQTCKVTDEDLRMIASLPKVRSLTIVGSQSITSEGLEALGRLENLDVLELNADQLTDQHLAVIGKLTTLQRLNIPSNPITSAGVRHLENLVELIQLSMSQCHEVDDAALPSLSKLKNLRLLYLYGTKIGESGKRLEVENSELQLYNTYPSPSNQRGLSTRRAVTIAVEPVQ